MTLVAGGARRRAVMRPEQRVGYVVFGVGVGGLADGFVLHQLLQCGTTCGRRGRPTTP